MRKRILCVAIISFIFAVAWPLSALAEGYTKALSVKVGKYEPTDDIDDLDGDLYGAISINLYLSPKFALEFGLGKFDAEETFYGFDPFILGSYSEKDEISVIPLTINAKGILPYEWGELYGGAGLGIYLVDFDANLNSSFLGTATFSDSDTVLGFQLIAGILFNITETVYLGIDGQYILTQEAQGSDVVYGLPISIEGDVNGYTFSGLFGFRF